MAHCRLQEEQNDLNRFEMSQFRIPIRLAARDAMAHCRRRGELLVQEEIDQILDVTIGISLLSMFYTSGNVHSKTHRGSLQTAGGGEVTIKILLSIFSQLHFSPHLIQCSQEEI